MDRKQLIKDAHQWIDDGDCDVYNQPGEAMADFALEQYEAGQRAERERIVRQFQAISQSDDGTCYADYSDAIDAFIDKLKADPAESGK